MKTVACLLLAVALVNGCSGESSVVAPAPSTTTDVPEAAITLVEVPDVSGESVAFAEGLLSTYGLETVVVESGDQKGEAGTVVGQRPAPGAEAAVGAVVVLFSPQPGTAVADDSGNPDTATTSPSAGSSQGDTTSTAESSGGSGESSSTSRSTTTTTVARATTTTTTTLPPTSTLSPKTRCLESLRQDGPAKCSGVNLTEMVFDRQKMNDSDFSEADLQGVSLYHKVLHRSDFSNADLSNADLARSEFDYADMRGVRLDGADATWASFQYANLAGADFEGLASNLGNLIGANLEDANLSSVEFSTGANLTGVNLSGANLSDARMVRLILRDADLSGANLTGVDLSGSDMLGADLSGAVLTDTIITANQCHSVLSESADGADLPPCQP